MDLFKQKALQWASQFQDCCFLDSNGYTDRYGKFDWLVAAGADRTVTGINGQSFQMLQKFIDERPAYIFGFLGYDLKNEIEQLSSSNIERIPFPPLYFFEPSYLIGSTNGEISIIKGDKAILKNIEDTAVPQQSDAGRTGSIHQTITKQEYINKIHQIKAHILRGDIYEMNFCQEFYAEKCFIDPVNAFQSLNAISPMPFAAFFKFGDRSVISASPERFLTRNGKRIISQPIKGTSRRHPDTEKDQVSKQLLAKSTKERAENIMIVDLVRNDLTRVALPASVTTDELCKIYTFPKVHQMISTISCEVHPNLHPVDAIKACFPMGSMTGAPKVKAMEMIEKYEITRRGIYSGSIGWINPAGDFDFNVIIRTLLFDAEQALASFSVGGAITYASNPTEEYEECLLKAAAMLELLGNKTDFI